MSRMSHSNDDNTLFSGFRIRLNPTSEQKLFIQKLFDTHRFFYNWAMEQLMVRKYSYMASVALTPKISRIEISNLLTEFRRDPENAWCRETSLTTARYAAFEACDNIEYAVDNCTEFDRDRYYRFIKKKVENAICFIRDDRFHIFKNHVKLPSPIGNVNTDPHEYKYEVNYHDLKYGAVRLTYRDGEYWISGFIKDPIPEMRDYGRETATDVVGIDIGASKTNWIVDSSGRTVCKPDVTRLQNHIKKLQRDYDHKQITNDCKTFTRENQADVKGKIFNHKRPMTKREVKLLKRIRKLHKRMANKYNNEILTYASRLYKQDPLAVVIEDLPISELIHRYPLDFKNVPSAGRRSMFSGILSTRANIIKKTLTNNSKKYGIPLIMAKNDYPSTQLCSNCGHRFIGKERMKLSDRSYICPDCGMVMDRDYNSAINLKYLGYSAVGSNQFPEHHMDYYSDYDVIYG